MLKNLSENLRNLTRMYNQKGNEEQGGLLKFSFYYIFLLFFSRTNYSQVMILLHYFGRSVRKGGLNRYEVMDMQTVTRVSLNQVRENLSVFG